MSSISYTDSLPRHGLAEALRRAIRAFERHEREVVELETRLAVTRRTLESAGYLRFPQPQPAAPTAPTAPRRRVFVRRLRVAVG